MNIIKEGLSIYRSYGQVEDGYFLSTEYHVLRKNDISTLLPVVLREENGERCLLYDVTGTVSLRTYCESKLTESKIRRFLKNLIMLCDDIEHYMLEMDQIRHSPDSIFVSEEGDCLWMYYPCCPNEEEEEKYRLEHLVSWMLSQMDYTDKAGVELFYDFYWRLRIQGVNRSIIRNCLHQSQEEDSRKKEKGEGGEKQEETAGMSYEEFFHFDEEASSLDDKYQSGYDVDYQKKGKECIPEREREELKQQVEELDGKWIRPISWILTIAVASDAVFTGYLVYLAYQYSFPPSCIKYVAVCGTILVILIAGVIRLRMYEKSRRELLDKSHNERMRSGRGAESRKTEERRDETFWEDNKTTVLTSMVSSRQASLQNMETGELYPVFQTPFYIGSSEEENQLVIHEKSVSRTHAVIRKDVVTGEYLMEDLHSTNGTTVNYVKVTDHPFSLKDGSRITFAEKKFVFQLG